jgi:hypothetical protein
MAEIVATSTLHVSEVPPAGCAKMQIIVKIIRKNERIGSK